jgi:hypothetical protein
VDEILVHRPWSLGGRRDGDVVLRSKGEQILPATELVAKFGQPPWGDDRKGGVKGLEGEFEADLVIAWKQIGQTMQQNRGLLSITFASSTVREVLALVLLSNLDHSTCNDRTGQRGA